VLRKVLYAPTTVILRELLSSQGQFGKVIEAALSGDEEAGTATAKMLEDILDNRRGQEALIAECEREMDRPKRDRIRKGPSLEWACRKLQDGCERLKDWLAAAEADGRLLDSHRRSSMSREIRSIRKELAGLQLTKCAETDDLDAAIDGVLNAAFRSLDDLASGRERLREPQRLFDVLDAPLLRLPAGCQPYDPPDGDAYAPERKAQRIRLFNALQNPQLISPTETTA
jgi:hypothetical protein